MKNILVGLLVLQSSLFFVSDVSFAQSGEEDLQIFGFSQIILNSRYTKLTLLETSTIPVPIKTSSYANSFALHQVNLFFRKSINEKTTFFLNIEATGSYSTKIPSGNFEIPEGWISFRLNENLELKTGLLLPRFNSLNEIQNRLPLLPYIIRPVVYENYFDNVFDPEDYLPSSGYIQLSGIRNISKKFNLDYVFFIGNAEDSFLSSVPAGSLGEEEESTALYQGENLNTQLLYGGRVGIENRLKTLKLGTSFTYDEDNKTSSRKKNILIPQLVLPDIGEITRYRIGVDLSFAYKKFVSETEIIGVFHDLREVHKIDAFKAANINKFFYVTNLTYNVTDDLYLFGYQSVLKENQSQFLAPNPPQRNPIYSFGGGWKINDVTVVKVQSMFSQIDPNDFVDYKLRFITIGVSTIF